MLLAGFVSQLTQELHDSIVVLNMHVPAPRSHVEEGAGEGPKEGGELRESYPQPFCPYPAAAEGELMGADELEGEVEPRTRQGGRRRFSPVSLVYPFYVRVVFLHVEIYRPRCQPHRRWPLLLVPPVCSGVPGLLGGREFVIPFVASHGRHLGRGGVQSFHVGQSLHELRLAKVDLLFDHPLDVVLRDFLQALPAVLPEV
mmetsp:Transcript_274/g.598  ORF Transcript_274/g.598 Transcript_274/m.598 type:complete len:200 (+) Transcript_274:1517-2116(+)